METEIQTISLIDNVFNDDEYVFLIGFNLGVVPKLKRDEDYLNDAIKPSVLENTSEFNNMKKNVYSDVLKNIKNLTITYKMQSPFNSYYPSFLIDGDYLVKVKGKFTISNYSNRINKLKLENISVIMESTGVYHRPIERYFLEQNFKVFVINPIYGKMHKRNIRKSW